MAEMVVRQRFYDSAAIAASLMCLVHCLIMPVLIVLIPTLGTMLALPESVHVWALLLAVPTSAAALWLGWQRHHRTRPAQLAFAGLVLLAAGVFVAPSEAIETVLTVCGAMALAIGHARNWRALQH